MHPSFGNVSAPLRTLARTSRMSGAAESIGMQPIARQPCYDSYHVIKTTVEEIISHAEGSLQLGRSYLCCRCVRKEVSDDRCVLAADVDS